MMGVLYDVETHMVNYHLKKDSALGKPQNLFAYVKPSLFELAASDAFGLMKNHSFTDGNKRTGFVVAVTFLQCNGWHLEASEVD